MVVYRTWSLDIATKAHLIHAMEGSALLSPVTHKVTRALLVSIDKPFTKHAFRWLILTIVPVVVITLHAQDNRDIQLWTRSWYRET